MLEPYSNLNKKFKKRVKLIIQNCLKSGVEMKLEEGIRNPFVQAKYWRQSRSIKDINNKINELNCAGAHFLAYCIYAIGPQSGKHLTNAIPGLSWHQWGEAVDCIWIVNGESCWDTKILINNINGYQVYGEEAKKLELDCGLFWSAFQDAAHVQLRPIPSPLSIYSILDIDLVMRKRFENLVN